MGKDAYYFSHDSNARTDPKILQMRSVYGFEGYGWYWTLIEMMREQENYELDLQGKYVFNAFALQMDTTAEKTQSYIEDCISEFKLFESNGKTFWSNSLKSRMQIKDEKSEKAKKSAEARWNKVKKVKESEDLIQTQSEGNANALKSDAIKESKENKSKENIYIVQSEQLWNLYPSKTGKANAIKKIPKLIEQYTYEQIERCIERYKQYVINRQNTDFPTLKYQNGSTFFNSGYVDYLDENYTPLQPTGTEQNNLWKPKQWK